MKISLLNIFLIFSFIFCFPPNVFAKMYTWVDEKGQTHLSDKPKPLDPSIDLSQRSVSQKQLPDSIISLDFYDTDVKVILRLMASVGEINITWGSDVKGKITTNIENIPWDQAFEMILNQNGLAYQFTDYGVLVFSRSKLLDTDTDKPHGSSNKARKQHKVQDSGTQRRQQRKNQLVREGVFVFEVPRHFKRIRTADLQNLKTSMLAGGRELAIMSESADPQLFKEEYLTFFAGYQSPKARIQIIMVGDKIPERMNFDEMFLANTERIEWGKKTAKLSKNSKGVSKVTIDGVPALLMDILSSQGERLQTYSFFHSSYPHSSFSVSIKGKSNDYKKYTQSIATFIDTLKLDFEGNAQSNTSVLQGYDKSETISQDVSDQIDTIEGVVEVLGEDSFINTKNGKYKIVCSPEIQCVKIAPSLDGIKVSVTGTVGKKEKLKTILIKSFSLAQ